MLAPVRLRPFIAQDVYPVIGLVDEAFGDKYDIQMYLELSGQWPEGFLVAEMDGAILGFLLGIVSSPGEARILMLAVRDGFKSRGIGTALLNAVLQRCALLGFTSVQLEVRVSNARAIAFYQRFNFSITGVIPQYYKNGENAYVMKRGLP